MAGCTLPAGCRDRYGGNSCQPQAYDPTEPVLRVPIQACILLNANVDMAGGFPRATHFTGSGDIGHLPA
jgi:hypothetical protein